MPPCALRYLTIPSTCGLGSGKPPADVAAPNAAASWFISRSYITPMVIVLAVTPRGSAVCWPPTPPPAEPATVDPCPPLPPAAPVDDVLPPSAACPAAPTGADVPVRLPADCVPDVPPSASVPLVARLSCAAGRTRL